jgi:hypothetical protein
MTDGTEHPDRASAPGQGPWNTPPAQQPPAAPGGYGYPPEQQAPGGYGYPPEQQQGFPQQQIPYGQQPGYQQPPAYQQPSLSLSNDLDWAALAERNEAQQRRRKRLWTTGIIVVACLLGVGAGVLVIRHENSKGEPAASASASPSASSSGKANSPTVPGQKDLLADKSGENNLALGPDAGVDDVGSGSFAARFRSNTNSYAQSSSQLIDVTKSFSVSAWVYNEAANSSRSAISQGDGVSSSFSLGREASGEDRYWVFKVQTAEGGADSTTFEAKASKDVSTVGAWVLLTGTYDASAKKISLYVDGKVAGSATVPGVWASKGPLQLGRARTHGVWGDFWAGVVGHIIVWDQALTADQVAGLKKGEAGGSAKPIASWLVG